MLMIHVLNDHVSIYEASAVICVARNLADIPESIWDRLDDDQQTNIMDAFFCMETE